MPDIFDLIAKWWKQILLFVLITIVVTAVIVFTMPKKYLGVASALPAATYSTDKAGVFAENVETLYPSIGTSDDLDMILGTSHLDTVYTTVAEQLSLADYFGIDKSDPERNKKAGAILIDKKRVIKSDYGDLKVKVWDGDRQRAADMANAIMDQLQNIHQAVQTANNEVMLEKIKEEYSSTKKEYQKLDDSLHSTLDPVVQTQKLALLEQLHQFEKLQGQYQLMVNAKPKSLVVVEKASPALWPDKPRPKETLIAAAVLSLFFGLLAALILERRRILKQ
jgi:capsular polysaccharide biosynthesis protein